VSTFRCAHIALLASGDLKVIVKPVDSAGSDSIFLCTSHEEVAGAVQHIVGRINQIGHSNSSALAQEFLEGTEFVVDSVSRDGVHKATAIWEYDKRSVNGANFVYHGMWFRSSADPRVRELIAYSKQACAHIACLFD
jgi:biotin carboxylase